MDGKDPTGTACFSMTEGIGSVCSGPGFAADSEGSNGRSHPVDRENQKKAEAAANASLTTAGVQGKNYGNKNPLVKAWKTAALGVAKQYHVELGAKIFEMKGGGFQAGGTVASASKCTSWCTVDVMHAPNVSGGVWNGYVHTHPNEDSFSGWDLYNTYLWGFGGTHDFSAYVVLPSGKTYRWDDGYYYDHSLGHQEDWSGYRSLETEVH